MLYERRRRYCPLALALRTKLLSVWSLLIMLLSGGSALAQLHDNCTVSGLNRTARVRADGSWDLRNVPAGSGRMRIHATCTENGVTRVGQSELLTIRAGETLTVPAIVLQPRTAVPTALTITASLTTLPAIGATAQLTVSATLPDTSTRNVTGASSGTDYTTSNRAIATVSAEGVVTAVAPGVVILSALHEGTLGLLRMLVASTSGDTDGDGIPDDVEVANGLNPNDPTDAAQDADSDGLTNKQELIDYNTNPRVADTDGDGVRDGLEIQTGSNPLDPGSRNLAQALTALSIVPEVFTLINNTLLSPPFRQLTVTGHLRDDSTIDLTAPTTGTSYTSSDDGVCSLSGSRISAESDGDCTITVANSGFTAQAVGTVDSFSPLALSSIAIPGYANNVDVSGTVAYVAAGAAGLQVVDITDLRNPQLIGALDTPGNANDVRVVGTLAYVADGVAGLQIVDVSTPTTPVLRGTFDTPGEAMDVRVIGTRAYIADGDAGLQIVDVTTPAVPVLLGTVDTPGTARGVDVSGTLAVVADGQNDPSLAGIVTVDVSVPATPQVLARLEIPGGAVDVVLRGTTAYVAGGFLGNFQIVDLRLPASPQLVANLPRATNFEPADLDVFSRFALAADSLAPSNRITITDIFDPRAPNFVASIDLGTVGAAGEIYGGTGIALTPQYVYATGIQNAEGLENGVTGTSRLFIGQYLKFPEDIAGVAPSVRILTPSVGATVAEEARLSIVVEAMDDVSVASVDIFVNGQVVAPGTDVFAYLVPLGATSLTIGARATDTGGNIGEAPEVVVAVVPDSEPPTVRITTPTPNTTVVEEAIVPVVVSATDNVAVASVELLVNGVVVETLTNEPYQFTLTVPTGVSSLTLSVRATDTNGHVATTAAVVVSVVPDTQPPTVQITAPVSGTTVTEGDFLSVTILASDNFGVTAVEVLLNGEVIETLTTPPYEAALTVPVGVTTFTIGARARDPKGNVGTAAEVSVSVTPDMDAPTVQIAAPSAGSTVRERSTLGISIEATDNVAATSFELLVDGQVVDTATFGFFNFVVPVGLTNLTLGARVRDPAGNIGVAPDVVLTVIPDLAPTVRILTPASGTTAIERTTVRVEVEASDDVLLTGLELLVDGQVVDTVSATGGIVPPYRFKVRIPVGASALTLGARATDLVGQSTLASEVELTVTPDPGTTVSGRVIDRAGAPVPNATVVCLGVTGESGSAGSFVLPGVPSIRGMVSCVATAPVVGGGQAGGAVPPFLPLRGGTVPVGDVVLAGTGTAPFYGPALSAALSSNNFAPGAVASGDLDGDGTRDLVLIRGSTVVVLGGNGDGTFTGPLSFPAGGDAQAVVVADVNRDNRVDVVTANGGAAKNIAVLLGNGDGTLQAPRLFSMPAGGTGYQMAVGDVTGDGVMDLIVTTLVDLSFFPGYGRVGVFVGNGEGSFELRRTFFAGLRPTAVEVRDVDKDGMGDVMVLERDSGSIWVFLSTGEGSFAVPRTVVTGHFAEKFVVTDVNGDGEEDVVLTTRFAELAVLLGDGDGRFTDEQLIAVPQSAVVVSAGDVNFDGRVDLVVVVGVVVQHVGVLVGMGEGMFSSGQVFAVGEASGGIVLDDVNGDGLPDVIAPRRSGSTTYEAAVFLHQ